MKPTELDNYYERFMDEFWPTFVNSPMKTREPFRDAFEAGARALFGFVFANTENSCNSFQRALRFFYNEEGK